MQASMPVITIDALLSPKGSLTCTKIRLGCVDSGAIIGVTLHHQIALDSEEALVLWRRI